MKLSTKGRYAITAMMELALHHKEGPVTLADISAEQSISVSYLEQLFAQLRKHGLVTGLRGPGGGYCLRRAANEISVAQILRAVDDSASTSQATSTEEPAAEPQPRAPSLVLWDQLSDRIYGYLDGITLADAIHGGNPTGEDSDKPAGDGMHRPAA